MRIRRAIVSVFGSRAWNLVGAAAEVTLTGYGRCRR
jgi:hypothetical protein